MLSLVSSALLLATTLKGAAALPFSHLVPREATCNPSDYGLEKSTHLQKNGVFFGVVPSEPGVLPVRVPSSLISAFIRRERVWFATS